MVKRDGYSDMCNIVQAFPPANADAASRIAEQLSDSQCNIPDGISVGRRVGDRICESASELAPPGIKNVVRDVCKGLVGTPRADRSR